MPLPEGIVVMSYGLREVAAVSTTFITSAVWLNIARWPDERMVVVAFIRFAIVASSVGEMT
jgi:hypothetical protein